MSRKEWPQLPVMQCDAGCPDCCGVVFCNQSDYDRVQQYAKHNGIEPKRQGATTCPFFQGGTCAVYPARPFVCRLFGHVPALKCSRGYNVDISPEREERLREEYERKGNPDRLLHEMAYEVSELNTLLEFELGHA